MPLVIGGLVTGCGGDGPPRASATASTGAAVPAPDTGGAMATSSGGGPAAASPAPRPRPAPSPREREGETSAEALFERARQALLADDDLVIVRCLSPEARRAWLSDALLAIEVEAQDPRYQDDLGRRRAVGALRDRMIAHLRERKPGGRPPSLGAAAVGEALLDRIEDPDALLAEILAVSRALGHPLDPVGAVERGVVGGDRPRTAPKAAAVPPGLPRALRRIERSRDLAEVHLDEGQGTAMVRSPDGGLEPVRLVRRGDTLWIDES